MRAIVIPRLGGPEVLRLDDEPVPSPGPRDVLVKLTYAGVNYADCYTRTGTYRGGVPLKETDAPLRLGVDGAGTVAAVGAEVSHLKPGDQVVYTEGAGSYAEYVAVPAWRVVKVPAGVTLEQAATAYNQGCTAHYLAHDTGRLGPGISCLVHAGAGGVGSMLVQFAKALGARVLTTVGSAEKADLVKRLGADVAIQYRTTDFLEAVKAETGGKGVDVVYDAIGPDTFEKSMKSLRPKGLFVLYGNTSGLAQPIDPMVLANAGSLFFTRPRLANHMTSAEEIAGRAGDIFTGLASGKLHATLGSVMPLERAADAHRLIESRQSTGKILLKL